VKIVICCKSFSSGGGAQTWLGNMTEALLADGHSVKILAAAGKGSMDGVELQRLSIPPVPKTLRDLAFAKACKKALSGERADVVFGEHKAWGADVIMPGGGVHRFYIQQTVRSYPFAFQRAANSLTRRLSPKELLNHHIEKKLYGAPGPACIITNSKMIKRHVLEEYPHLEGRVEAVYNAVDCERFHPELRTRHREEVRRELGIPSNALVGVFVAMDWRRKGLHTIIRALSILKDRDDLPPVYAIVVGKGKVWRAAPFAWINEVLDRLRFVGYSKPDRYYGASDMVLLPSFFDPCANVTTEGLAVGLPVITSKWNGGYELISPGENGFYVDDPADAGKMAAFIEHFADEEARDRAADSAREEALKHKMGDMYSRVKQILVDVGAES